MMLFHAKFPFMPGLALRKRSRKTRDDKYRDQKNHCGGKNFCLRFEFMMYLLIWR